VAAETEPPQAHEPSTSRAAARRDRAWLSRFIVEPDKVEQTAAAPAAMVRRQPHKRRVPPVAYCPMARKHWLQSGDKVQNPFYGRAMSECGRIVSALPDLTR
jgi:anti-sigma factor ChrR (cupin superfamily)